MWGQREDFGQRGLARFLRVYHTSFGLNCSVASWTTWVWNRAGPLIYGFFSNKHAVCPSKPQVSSSRFNQLQVKKVFLICSRDSVDVEGRLDALSYVILYKEPEHPWISVSTWALEAIPGGYCWTTVVKFWGVKSYTQTFCCTGISIPDPHVFKGQLLLSMERASSWNGLSILNSFRQLEGGSSWVFWALK